MTEAVVALLQRTLPTEGITPAAFARRVLLDPNFDPDGAQVALCDQGVVGFALALRRRRPLEDAAPEATRGWITLFAVDAACRRQGVGTALFRAAEMWLKAQGCVEVLISPYAPGYWLPGVDEAAYPDARAFLLARGYTAVYRPLSMSVDLDGWTPPPGVCARTQALFERGVICREFEAADTLPLTEFLRREFPGDWQRHLRETMHDILRGQRSETELLLAWEPEPVCISTEIQRLKLVGFAQCDAERFGPFGVAESARGRGIGALLLIEMLARMRRRGLSRAWFMWTNDATADRLYRPVGFVETRRYVVLRYREIS
jgi:GNAT superfamily N-acetyltransferase